MSVLALLCLAIGLHLGSAISLTSSVKSSGPRPDTDSEWSFTDPQANAKKQMLFLHFEKSAGSYVGSVLKSAVGDAHYMDYHYCGVPITDVPPQYFVVAAVRNPCDQAVSQWEFQCEKTYLLRTHGQPNGAANAQLLELLGMCPSLNSRMDWLTHQWEAFPVDPYYAGFQASLNVPDRASMYQTQVQHNLQSIGFDRVNCWVRFEDLDATMMHCLQEFHAVTGKPVDLSAVEAPTLATTQAAHSTDSHHGSCKDYFPNTAAGNAAKARVLHGNRMLFEYFNYTTCC